MLTLSMFYVFTILVQEILAYQHLLMSIKHVSKAKAKMRCNIGQIQNFDLMVAPEEKSGDHRSSSTKSSWHLNLSGGSTGRPSMHGNETSWK